MSETKNTPWLVGILVLLFCGFGAVLYHKGHEPPPQPPAQMAPNLPSPPPPATEPKAYAVPAPVSGYLSYPDIVATLKQWNQIAPEITEVGVYGHSTQGKDLYYIRFCANKSANKPKVLLTACIHGNEHIATATLMGVAGTMLSQCNRDPQVTRLFKERDIYWIPVVCPDSYEAVSRQCDGVDPNRNFPYPGNMDAQSIPPIEALRNFFLQKQFKAVLSGHAYGQIFLYPWGYSVNQAPDDAALAGLCNEMANLAGYKAAQCRKVPTATPYHGFELDWFYLNGAFACVCEMGTEFKPATSAIAPEIQRVYPAWLMFIEKAPLVDLKK